MPQNDVLTQKRPESTFLIKYLSKNYFFEITQSKYIWVKIENVTSDFFAKNLISPYSRSIHDSSGGHLHAVDMIQKSWYGPSDPRTLA
jgi:hypothetical protein